MSDNDNEIISTKYNPNFTQQELANKFEIGWSTVAEILAQASYWLGLDEESTIAQQKRNRLPDHLQLEEILAYWFDLVLENHLTITGLILQEKAKQVAIVLNILHRIVDCSEAASAPIEKLPEFRQSLQNETSNYDLIDIYNCDETALYWLLEPSKSLTHGRISGIKKPKNWVTVMLTCNAVDRSMRCAHQKILLLLDNCLAHSVEGLNLRNVKVVFLPECTTAWLQPCDAGIIYSFKCYYRKLLLQNRIAAFDESNLTNQPPDPVTIYDAIQFVAQAWNKVSENTIIHFWHKTDINLETIDLTNEEEIELENLILQFQNSNNSEYLNISSCEFIEVDNNYTTGKMSTIEDIIAEMQENESEEELGQQIKPVTAIQAIMEFDAILGYIEQPESSLEIDIKVFAELKHIQKELVYL
ncbi:34525_t:CDS:2, partial [Gigaspora margarita]